MTWAGAEAEVVQDDRLGLVLVRGTPRRAVWLALLAADLTNETRWSDSGGGWLLPAHRAAAVRAALVAADVRVRWHHRHGQHAPDPEEEP